MWEQVGEVAENRFTTQRCKVPGGWLVRTFASMYGSGAAVSVHTVFVPDSMHEWRI